MFSSIFSKNLITYLRVSNGPEFISSKMDALFNGQRIELLFTLLGKPMRFAFVEPSSDSTEYEKSRQDQFR
jgi:hypothetical protein